MSFRERSASELPFNYDRPQAPVWPLRNEGLKQDSLRRQGPMGRRRRGQGLMGRRQRGRQPLGTRRRGQQPMKTRRRGRRRMNTWRRGQRPMETRRRGMTWQACAIPAYLSFSSPLRCVRPWGCGPHGYSTPRHQAPFQSRNEGLGSKRGTGGWGHTDQARPRHEMPFNARTEGLGFECGGLKWVEPAAPHLGLHVVQLLDGVAPPLPRGPPLPHRQQRAHHIPVPILVLHLLGVQVAHELLKECVAIVVLRDILQLGPGRYRPPRHRHAF